MGQKVNPISMRLQVNKDWRSKWFVDKRDYAKFLKDDLAVRKLIADKLGSRGAINRVEINRTPNLVTVTISTAHQPALTSKKSRSQNSTPSLLPRTSRTSWSVV
jgi:small subunit ribosomal protein S3